jgi:hypothetical protein
LLRPSRPKRRRLPVDGGCSLFLPPPFRPGLDDGLLMGRGLGIVNEIGPDKAHCLDMS